ncbi:MAG: hypothetical protein ABR519_04870 [Bacteroidales bacterium]
MIKLLRRSSGAGTLTEKKGILMINSQEYDKYSGRKTSNRW